MVPRSSWAPAAAYLAVVMVVATTHVRLSMALMPRQSLRQEGYAVSTSQLIDVVLAIEDHLKSLSTRNNEISRLDLSMVQMARRIEAINVKLESLEGKIERSMDRLEVAVAGKNLKGEAAADQLHQRMEIINERLSHKTELMEGKALIWTEQLKNKFDKMEQELQSSMREVMKQVGDDGVGKRLAEVENHMVKFEESLVHMRKTLHRATAENEATTNELFSKVHVKMDNNTDVLKQFIKNQTESLKSSINTQFSSMNGSIKEEVKEAMALNEKFESERLRSKISVSSINEEKINNLTNILHSERALFESRLDNLDSDLELYTKKVVNSMQELWRKADEARHYLNQTLTETAMTRNLVNHMVPWTGARKSHVDDSDLEPQIRELGLTVGDIFLVLLDMQKNCFNISSKIQNEEAQLFDIIYYIISEVQNNSTADITSRLEEYNDQLRQLLIELKDHVVSQAVSKGNAQGSCCLAWDVKWPQLSETCQQMITEIWMDHVVSSPEMTNYLAQEDFLVNRTLSEYDYPNDYEEND